MNNKQLENEYINEEQEEIITEEKNIDFEELRICKNSESLYENKIFYNMIGEEVLLIMSANQLNILGQTFRPIFCGTLTEVSNGFITLDPVIIKMNNAPFHRFPTPLNFPIEKITHFLKFDCETRFPIS